MVQADAWASTFATKLSVESHSYVYELSFAHGQDAKAFLLKIHWLFSSWVIIQYLLEYHKVYKLCV